MKRKPNIIIEGEIARIELTQGQWALVDTEDLERLPVLKTLWCSVKKGRAFYAKKIIGGVTAYMHNLIFNEQYIDHINHIGTDNRKANLRIATTQQNAMNKLPHKNSTSQYKGVSWKNRDNIYSARICHNGKEVHIGNFKYEEEAALAYNEKAKELFGEFAYLNIIREDGKGID